MKLTLFIVCLATMCLTGCSVAGGAMQATGNVFNKAGTTVSNL